jgi:TRAP-type C4-dicarboxylate transport system substrate-binding protein
MNKFKTLLLAHHGGDNHAIKRVVQKFSENVAQRTGGQIAIATVPNSSLGNISELLRLVLDGTADMALPPFEWLGRYAPKFGCVAAPFVFDDHAHADRLLDGEFKAWAMPELDALGIVFLAGWEWGFRQISNCLHPILRPEDIRGLRIRVPLVPPYRAAIVAFGGIPVMVDFSRFASVIGQGLIDGQENPVSIYYSLGLQFDQKFLSLLNYSYGILGHVINSNCFKSLTVEHQGILCEESLKASQLMRQLVHEQEAEQLVALASQGVRIDRPDPAPFKALMQPVYRQLGASFGAENMRAFMAMVDRQRKAGERVFA